MLKKLLAGVAISAAFAAAPAHAFLENWFIDADGAGAGGRDQISEYLDIVGPSYVATTVPNGVGQFAFVEDGAVVSSTHDGGAVYTNVSAQLAAVFDITGVGTLGGQVLYTGGTISVYSNAPGSFATAAGNYGADTGTLIGTFSPITGGGAIDPTGIPNGVQTISAAATFLAPGYWFDPNGVTDLSTLVGGPTPTVFGFATTNASRVANATPLVISEIVAGLGGVAGYTNPGCLPGQVTAACATGAGSFVISNNGQFRLQVPEPSGVALGGLAFVLAGLFARRRLGSK